MFGWRSKHQPEKQEEKSWTLDAPGPELFELFGAGPLTASGETVGPEAAMRVPAALCATRTIAETMASLPIHVFRRGPGDTRERDRDHPAAKVLARPAPWTSAYEFKLGLVTDAIRHGRGCAVAVRASDEIRELHRIFHSGITIERDLYSGEPSYLVNPRTGAERRYSWRDVVDVVPFPSHDAGGAPTSLVHLARESIGFAATLEKHGARLFGNGARPSGVLSFKGKLNEMSLKNRLALWNRTHGGARAGGTAVMDEGAEYQQLSLNSTDAQFLELRHFQVLEIGRAFRVPAHMLLEMERATHANSEELGLQFASYCLRPWADLIEGALSRVLFTDAERDEYFIETLFDDLIRGNTLQRLEALSKAVGGPFMTPDEARATDNRPKIAGGDKLNQPQGVGSAPDNVPSENNVPPGPDPKLRAVA